MAKKINREEVRQKFNGLCAYTGKDLGSDWQIDHMTSSYKHSYHEMDFDKNSISNLMPTCRIINHYKRALDLEGFRDYILTLHIRIAKLPKKTSVKRTENRIKYLNTVAQLFDITPEKPFDGVFYFEKLNK